MTPKRALQVGDRVAVYDKGMRYEGTIETAVPHYDPKRITQISVKLGDRVSIWVCPQQVRRLLPRKSRKSRKEWHGRWEHRYFTDGRQEIMFKPDAEIPELRPLVGEEMWLRQVRRK